VAPGALHTIERDENIGVTQLSQITTRVPAIYSRQIFVFWRNPREKCTLSPAPIMDSSRTRNIG
jgi:hypothetical protein